MKNVLLKKKKRKQIVFFENGNFTKRLKDYRNIPKQGRLKKHN